MVCNFRPPLNPELSLYAQEEKCTTPVRKPSLEVMVR